MNNNRTSSINIEERSQLHAFLKSSYPDLFARPYSPLSLDIDKQVAAIHGQQFSVLSIKGYLSRFVRSKDYLMQIVERGAGATRHNLDGSHSQPVSVDELTYATHRLGTIDRQ